MTYGSRITPQQSIFDYETERLCSLKYSWRRHTFISRPLEVHDTHTVKRVSCLFQQSRRVTYCVQVSEPDTLVTCLQHRENVYAEILLTKLASQNILATPETELNLARSCQYILNPVTSHTDRIEITGKPHQAIRF